MGNWSFFTPKVANLQVKFWAPILITAGPIYLVVGAFEKGVTFSPSKNGYQEDFDREKSVYDCFLWSSRVRKIKKMKIPSSSGGKICPKLFNVLFNISGWWFPCGFHCFLISHLWAITIPRRPMYCIFCLENCVVWV